MKSIREILRALLMGPRYEKYWRDLRSQELNRYGYDKKRKPAGKR